MALLPVLNFLLLDYSLLIGCHQLLIQCIYVLLDEQFRFIGLASKSIDLYLPLQVLRKFIVLDVQP